MNVDGNRLPSDVFLCNSTHGKIGIRITHETTHMSTAKGKVRIAWSPSFAYAIGLLVADGNLSSDGRHINFTTKDTELAQHFLFALNIIGTHIGMKSRGGNTEKRYFTVQFSDVLFYRFLCTIGLMPNKSCILQEVLVPDELFHHFLRGYFDGDGTSISYWDTRWKSSFMYYISFSSASPPFLRWLQKKIANLYDIHGAINSGNYRRAEQLSYAKTATKKLFSVMYHEAENLYLTRKHLKISRALSIVSPP